MCTGKYRVRRGSLCTPHFQMGWLLLMSGALGSPFPSDASPPGPETASTGVSDKAPTGNPAGGSGSWVMRVGPDLMSCKPSSLLLALEEEICLAQQTRFHKPYSSFLTQSKLSKETGSSRHDCQTFQ